MPEMRGPSEAPDDQMQIYRPGDIVWVKLQAIPWWPAEVVLPEERACSAEYLKSVVAVVKTFKDDFLTDIIKQDKIAPFEDTRKDEWIKKGQYVKRSDLQTMFLPAVRLAEERQQETERVKKKEVEDQESRGACETCSGVSSSPSRVEASPKRKRKGTGTGKAVGSRKLRRRNSHGCVDRNHCTPCPPPTPPSPPPLPPSPPQSDKDFVRHDNFYFDLDDLPRITPPAKLRSQHWPRRYQWPETVIADAKGLVSEKNSMQINIEESHGADCVEISSRADKCDGAISISDQATAVSSGFDRHPTSNSVDMSELQDEKATPTECESESVCDLIANEGSDNRRRVEESSCPSPTISESLPLPVTPVKEVSPSQSHDLLCSPAISNCSVEKPFPFSPEKDIEDENSSDTDALSLISLASSSSSGVITFPPLHKMDKCFNNRMIANSPRGNCGNKSASACSIHENDRLLSGEAGKTQETCTLELEEALTRSAKVSSSQEDSPVPDLDEKPLGPSVDAEPGCESQSLPLPPPQKRKRGRPRRLREDANGAEPCKEAKVEKLGKPVEVEGSKVCPLAIASSSLDDTNNERGRGNDNADSDSESELPDVLKLSPEEMKYPQENSVVWVKFQQYPFWPSVVIKVLKLKKRIRKIKVVFLGEGPRSFLVSYSKKNVIYPFSGPHYQKLVDEGRDRLNKKEVSMKNFNDALHLAYQHLNAEMFKSLLSTELEPKDARKTVDAPVEATADASPEVGKAHSKKAPSKKSKTSQQKPPLQRKMTLLTKPTTSRQASKGKVSKTTSRAVQEKRQRAKMLRRQQMLNKLFASKAKRKKRNIAIVDFIKSEAAEAYLQEIFHGRIYSERHRQYLDGIRERDKLKYAGFGPIDDEEQQQDILEHLTKIYKRCSDKVGLETYVLDVWVPEAVVLSLRKTRKQAAKKAWDMFGKGVRLMQVERELIHEEIAANIKRIKTADTSAEEEAVETASK